VGLDGGVFGNGWHQTDGLHKEKGQERVSTGSGSLLTFFLAVSAEISLFKAQQKHIESMNLEG